MTDAARPLGALVVARWYPAYDDPGRGGFIADQVEGLLATGRVAPAVLSFEDVRLSGTASEQVEAAAALAAFDEVGGTATRAAWADAGLHAPAGIPVRRARVPHWSAAERRPGQDGSLHATAAVTGVTPIAVDVVHAHGGYPDGVAAAMVAATLGRPYVLTEHASYVRDQLADPTIRAEYLRVATGAARIIVVSRTLAARLGAAAPELADHLTVLPNAIAIERLRLVDPAERRADELLYLGGRRDTKGIRVLLEAFALVRSTRPALVLRLIGTAPSGDEAWRTLAASLGIADAVTFEGPTDRDGVMAALGRATLFVHPSPAETFGVVAAEALATGLPVVAADSGGVTEILDPDPDRFGAIVPSGDPAALAAAIGRTLGRLGDFDRTAMRQRIVERYGARSVADRLAALYADVVAEAGSPATLAGREVTRADEAVPGATRADLVLDRPVVVVGLDRARTIAKLAAIPASVRSRIHVVTVAGDGTLPVDLAGRHEPDVDLETRKLTARKRRSKVRRLWYRIADRSDEARRSRRRGTRIEAATTTLTDILAGLPGLPALHGERPMILPIDGLDHVVALAAVRAGAADASPGSLRWLTDQAASRSR